MKLIVGLGNPGEQYKFSRHNLGFMALDSYTDRLKIPINKKKKKTLFGKCVINGEDTVFLKPQTFMNQSGEAVLYMASFLKIHTSDIIVICDDINLDFGEIRIRPSGSDGGHNGLKSLISSLQTTEFPRIRMGVGLPLPSNQLEEHVLDPFSKEESKLIKPFLDKHCDALDLILNYSIEKAMNDFNGKITQNS
ncbi:MAG: aminoacyl-tRNA hydrolase [Spirochaetes bacterium]|nr:aminoacyl-tRNA hydrolase [Spirochaetota bacterium]MCK5268012.1 aminoacyl-tRNA hydrolase [Spirochaetota bacterium]